MRNINALIWLLIICLLIFSCSIDRKILNVNYGTACLNFDPQYFGPGAEFNPYWISKNGVRKVIEREYLDGRNGRIHLVTVLYFNRDGYIETKYSGLGYPKDDSPNEQDIFSKWDYTYKYQDSFLIQQQQVVRFFDEHGALEKPDTLDMTQKILNVKKAKKYLDENNRILLKYEYDKYGNLKSVYGFNGLINYRLNYLKRNKIEVEKYSYVSMKIMPSIANFNENGQLVRFDDASSGFTYDFLYNEKGEMIEEKSQFKTRQPIYYTYEYFK
jgi:hypothetical protein